MYSVGYRENCPFTSLGGLATLANNTHTHTYTHTHTHTHTHTLKQHSSSTYQHKWGFSLSPRYSRTYIYLLGECLNEREWKIKHVHAQDYEIHVKSTFSMCAQSLICYIHVNVCTDKFPIARLSGLTLLD